VMNGMRLWGTESFVGLNDDIKAWIDVHRRERLQRECHSRLRPALCGQAVV
jgi:hypothetical protein